MAEKESEEKKWIDDETAKGVSYVEVFKDGDGYGMSWEGFVKNFRIELNWKKLLIVI